jgi:hypothetical protein
MTRRRDLHQGAGVSASRRAVAQSASMSLRTRAAGRHCRGYLEGGGPSRRGASAQLHGPAGGRRLDFEAGLSTGPALEKFSDRRHGLFQPSARRLNFQFFPPARDGFTDGLT